jgi:hypothetical protein
MMKSNALIIPLVFGIPFFTSLNANLSFVQLFQPGAQDELLLPDTHKNNNKEEVSPPVSEVAQNKACNNNAGSTHVSC